MGPKKQGPRKAEGPLRQAKKQVLPEVLDVSSILRASSLDREPQISYGYPLHSTALEEDLALSEETEEVSRPAEKVEKKVGGRAGGPGKAATSAGAKQRPAASPRSQEGPRPGDKRKSVGEKVAAGPGKEPGAEKEKKKGGKSADRKSSSSETPTPGPKRARTRKSSSGQSADRQQQLARTSSSPGGDAEPTVSQTDRTGGRSRGTGGADVSVVLESFLSLCQTYKESVESTAVRRAIDTFSSSLEEQLTERITISKEFRVLKRDNAKVDSKIKAKRQKLLEAKFQRLRAERQLGSLRKEEEELRARLAHIRRGFSSLHGLRDLTTRYLAHRRAHPSEKEQFGSPSLPALLLETKSLLRAEDSLRDINNRLEAGIRE